MKAKTCGGKGPRRLYLEPLEDRPLLDAGHAPSVASAAAIEVRAAPWQNPVYRLDVDNSGTVDAQDVHLLINRLLATGSGPLSPPQGIPIHYYDTNGDNYVSPSDLLKIINRLNASPPQVTISTLAPFSVDVTPQVSVSATSPAGVADNAPVKVDVDLNDDGIFGPSERNLSLGSLFHGAGTFDLNSPLPANNPQTGPYAIKLRAHVQDTDGIEGISAPLPLVIDTMTSDALKNYVDAADPTYKFTVDSVFFDPQGQYSTYFLNMTSQTWRTSADVTQPVWQHWLQIIVPAGTIPTTALLLIDGGSAHSSPPWTPNPFLVAAALQSHSVVIDLPTVPNEPLTFTGNPLAQNLTEDRIIAYSFDQFLSHLGDSGNETWPALVAMTKSAVAAMNTVQAFVPTVTSGQKINDFVVTGYSKRGWTTWLTAAVDDRVTAIIPGVFDNLNQGPQMVHHYGVYGFFAPAVAPYQYFHIFDRILTPGGEELSKIVDPYRYLKNGRFDNMPKLMINSAGDQFFVSDSAQFYLDDLPGTENYFRYIPNVNHGLGLDQGDTRVLTTSGSFYDAILNNRPLPTFSWHVQADGSIQVQTVTAPTQVLLWQITNPNARDFRKDFLPSSMVWTSTPLSDQGGGTYVGNVPVPTDGATAYFVELTFPSVDPTNPFVFTTDIHVQTKLALYPWPFAASLEANASPTVTADTSPVTFGLAVQASSNVASGTQSVPAAGSLSVLNGDIGGSTASAGQAAAVLPMVSDASSAGDKKSSDGEPDADLVDDVLGSVGSDELANALA
ncbi:MAG: hypothetical protein HY288_10660 [Planctomycetia bacterium]|nr:hypothetical protein [Planctomycetia bacterium]